MTAECDFVNKANSLDKIEEEAKGRKARGEAPGELYLYVSATTKQRRI